MIRDLFRGFVAAASLKRAGRGGGTWQQWPFLRRCCVGLVSARAWCLQGGCCRLLCSLGFVAAASLKHGELDIYQYDLLRLFRGFVAAASLKRPGRGGGRVRRRLLFRGFVAAASLKRAICPPSLKIKAGALPRFCCRG